MPLRFKIVGVGRVNDHGMKSNEKISLKKYFSSGCCSVLDLCVLCILVLIDQTLVVVVDRIEIILHGVLCDILPFSLQNILLGDLDDDLLDHGVGHVGGHGLQDEGLPAGELHGSQPGGGDFSEEDSSGEVRDHQPGESVDEAEDGDTDESHPPHPEDQEILLVEDVVVKDAEIVAGVDTTRGGSDADVAGNLGGEKLAHGVVSQILPVLAHLLLLPDVLEHLLAVVEELVEEESVSDEHGEDAHHHVEELAESKVDLISFKPHPEAHKVLGDLGGVGSGSDDVLQHVALQQVPPQGAGQLGEAEAECEEERQPEIVGGDGGISRRLHLILIDIAASGLPLEVLLHIGSSVDPAVGPRILVSTLADDGSSVQMILQENKEQAEHHDEGGCLMMELKERIVYCQLVTLEPF